MSNELLKKQNKIMHNSMEEQMKMSERIPYPCLCGSTEFTIGSAKFSKKQSWLKWYLHCKKCSCNIYGYNTKKDLIKAWNTRNSAKSLSVGEIAEILKNTAYDVIKKQRKYDFDFIIQSQAQAIKAAEEGK